MFSDGVGGNNKTDGDNHSRLSKNNSVQSDEKAAAQGGPPNKTTVNRRRLRAPVWARSMSQNTQSKKLLPFFMKFY